VTGDPLRGLEPQPTGFGTCAGCPYRDVGSVAICYPCARQTMRELPRSRCSVCQQEWTAPRTRCSNRVCHWPDRQFDWNAAVAMRSGALEQAINRYKYDGVTGWALIFGRVLAGFLHDQQQRFTGFHLVIPSPTYVGPGGRSFDHTALVLSVAAELDETRLPFVLDPPVLVKTGPTTPLVGLGWYARRDVCRDEVPRVLQVPAPGRVKGKRVLVYDDVFTDGLNLNAMAKKLREAGAVQVCGVTLARQPWRV
jgi:predicted amidophosphoribosyltransferase